MGNPGDYVWGQDGLDAIVTQLLNQLDGTGPPPLPRKKIDEIPTIIVSQTHVGEYNFYKLPKIKLYLDSKLFLINYILSYRE